MGCLYCGKDIGPFRLLRDNEFCSAAHRVKYGERLGKVLDRIGAPELVPSGIPGACKQWPYQEGRQNRSEGVWDFGRSGRPVLIGGTWPLKVTPTLGEDFRRSVPAPVVMFDEIGAAALVSPKLITLPVNLPRLPHTLQSGPPRLAATLKAKEPKGVEPRQSPPKGRVVPLPPREISSDQPKADLPGSLLSFDRALFNALPTVDAAIHSRSLGVPPQESRAKTGVLPLPAGMSRSNEPAGVRDPFHPILRRVDHRMPGPPPEPAERGVYSLTAGHVTAVVACRLPGLQNFPLLDTIVAPMAGPLAAPSAQPVASFLEARSRISLLDHASIASQLPAIALQPIVDVIVDSGTLSHDPVLDSIEDSPYPAIAGPAPSPVTSWVTPASVLSPLNTISLRLPEFGSQFDSAVSAGLSRTLEAGRPGSPALPSPIPPLIAAVAPGSPTAIQTSAPELQLPAVDGLPVPAAAKWTNYPTWPSPAEAFIPPARVPESLPVELNLRLPSARLVAQLTPYMGSGRICPTAPSPVATLLPEAAAEAVALLAGPTLPSPVSAWIPLPGTPEPIALDNLPAIQLPRFSLVPDVSASMAESENCTDWPAPAQAFIPYVIEPRPFAVAAAQLPAVGRGLEIPSLLTRLRTPAAYHEGELQGGGTSLRGVAQPATLTGYSPQPVPVEPPAVVLSLRLAPKAGASSAAAAIHSKGLAASPVESLPAFAPFAPFRILNHPEVQFPQVPVPQSTGLSEAGSDGAYPEVASPEPRELNRNAALLQPIGRLKTAPLELPAEQQTPVVPRPGFIPVEFYCQRGWVAPCQRLEWTARHVEPLTQPFSLRAVADKSDDPTVWKPAPKAPVKSDVPAVSSIAKRRAREVAIGRFLKVAACLVMGVFLWFGAREVKVAGTPAISTSGRGSASASVSAPAASPGGTVAPAPDSNGVLAGMKKAMAERAAYSATDTLQTGMQSWGTAPKAWAPGWSRNPDGYVHPGDLALFRPSLGFKDYRLEFFGQIENKSMDWVVRAKDQQNYYAMKFTVIEGGLRPVIAMAHYPVVGGRKGQKVETPLSVMVHHNTPMHVAVDVQGNRVTASIEGQQVDSWTDDLLPKGGVGFFSDAGERARIYWMKVSKNQDWLGAICSYFAGDAAGNSRDTAEVWGQGIPGDVPAPRTPSQPQDVVLAEVETNAIDFRSPQRGRIG